MVLLAISEMKNDTGRDYMLSLYQNYYKLVWKTIYSITHDNRDMEDLINDVYIKIIEKIPLIRTLNCCKTTSYIVYTARSVAINYLRRRNVENKHAYYGEESDLADDLSAEDNDINWCNRMK